MAASPTSPLETPPCTALELEAMRGTLAFWQGTPHRDRMAKVGVGIDCIHLVRECYVAAGLIPEFRFPYYHPRMGLGRDNNVMERVFTACTEADAIDPELAPADGDVLIWRVGNQSNHCGIYFDGMAWHVMAKARVRPDPFEPLRYSMQSFIRLRARGFVRRPETLTPEDFAQP